MSVLEAIYSAGFIGNVIAVPVLREIAAIFLAFAISKDCKARDNGSSVLWGIFTLISPLIAGVVYGIYSRFFSDRKAETDVDKKRAKSSVRLCILAVFTYIMSFIMLIISVIAITSAGLAGQQTDDFDMFIRYYDRNQIEYSSLEEVPLFDKENNMYHIDNSSFFIVGSYYDDNGTEYDYDNSYISEDGYFYYDESKSLKENDDGYFYDADGRKYALIDDWIYWDKDGKIHFTSGKVTSDRLAFDE